MSLSCFAASLLALLRHLALPNAAKWTAASMCLVFSPTYVGILNGNPGVLSISLAILSLHFAMRNRFRISGLLFGVTLCLKPQIAFCSLLAFLLWKCWSPLLLGSILAAVVSIIATLQASAFGQDMQWWASLQANFAKEASPGGLVDPRPSSPYLSELLNSQTWSYLLTPNPRIAEGLVLLLMAALLTFYFHSRNKDHDPPSWIDAAFFALVTLAITYHRYYDGQLLLILVPATVCFWQSGNVRTASVLAVCFLLVALPFQSVFNRQLGPAGNESSFAEIILLRIQPIAILAATLVLSFRHRVWR